MFLLALKVTDLYLCTYKYKVVTSFIKQTATPPQNKVKQVVALIQQLFSHIEFLVSCDG